MILLSTQLLHLPLVGFAQKKVQQTPHVFGRQYLQLIEEITNNDHSHYLPLIIVAVAGFFALLGAGVEAMIALKSIVRNCH
ncbi:MAG: hypothetical protein ABH859_04930 [Pseudomonadota bacterium]